MAADGMRRQDFKVVILGASGVGKTCLGLRFVKDQFVTYTASTIGASFLVKELNFNNQKVTLQIWDTAGQERFRSMAPLYYRGAVAAILVFSMTDEVSFEKLKEWVRELQNNVEEPLVLAIACNKADLADQRVISAETAMQYANSIGALCFETSAKTSTGMPRAPPWAALSVRSLAHRSLRREPRLPSLRAYRPPPSACVRAHLLLTGVSQLFHEVARRLVNTKSRSADTASSSTLPPLPDPLAPDGSRRSKCC